MKTSITLVVATLYCLTLFGQEEPLASLKNNLPRITDSSRYVDALNRIAMLAYEQGADTTLLYANKARDISRRINYPKGIADATNNLGIFFDINGNSELALRYYSDAYNQYRRLGDSSNIVQTMMNIAMVYNSRGDDEKAVSLYKQAVYLGSSLLHDSIASLAIYNYLLQYPNRIAADSIDYYIDKAVRIGEKYHDTRILLAIGQLKANRYLQNGRRDTAIQLLQQSLAGGLHEKLYFMTLDILGELGDIYSTTDSAKAVGYYQQALDITEQKDYLSYTLIIADKLFAFYSAKKDKAKMLQYSTTLVKLYKDKQQISSQSGIDYISYALKDQQLQAIREHSAYEHSLLWLESAAILLVATICFILWRNTRKSRRTNAILQEQYKKLASTTAALETSNKNYARLIRVIAHDLRNPIGAISSIAGMKNADAATQTKDKEWITLVDEASSRCLQLIVELLQTDLSISESSLRKEEVNLDTLLQQTVLLLAYRANEKKQHLLIADKDLPSIQADKDKLARVLDNLVVNAIKFSPENATISLRAETSPKETIISVHDNGIGIPQDMAILLFEPFVNSVRRKGTSGEQSFGLGLYICRQIIEAHGGRIWFESHPGKGSTFFISIPR